MYTFFLRVILILINYLGDAYKLPVKTRTFGWVQNPSDFQKLKNAVHVFNVNSKLHKSLIEDILPDLVHEEELLKEMIIALDTTKPTISYKLLVGTSYKPRSEAPCDGIIQASIKSQKKTKPYIDNWSADGFIRWAYALGFISYNREYDTFTITSAGEMFSESKKDSKEEKEILINALMSYPPAVRILRLLCSGIKKGRPILTKFELGKNLGFNGENGFTSYPLDIILDTLALTEDPKERNKIKTDWEGSADKYARMISKWLEKLGLVSQVPVKFNVDINDENISVEIGHAYKITGHGINAYNKAMGKSKHSVIPKNVCWEMLATNVSNKNYVRSRRAFILKYISTKKREVRFSEIQGKLQSLGFKDDIERIRLDIKGLKNMGLHIRVKDSKCEFKDMLTNDFNIPPIKVTEELVNIELENRKSNLRKSFKILPDEKAELLEIAYDPDQNRLLEMEVMSVFKEFYGFKGKHLGGSRKPDGALFASDFGLIVDTKAYSKGYSLPIKQADEMERYITENKTRDKKINENEWWKVYPQSLKDFFYLFVSGHFTGKFQQQLERLSAQSGYMGGAIGIESFLRGADLVASGKQDLMWFRKQIKNKEIII